MLCPSCILHNTFKHWMIIHISICSIKFYFKFYFLAATPNLVASLTIYNCRLPTIQQDVQQRKLLYMGLYLLIWGEAANLRFMPECLCYIYHHVCLKCFFFSFLIIDICFVLDNLLLRSPGFKLYLLYRFFIVLWQIMVAAASSLHFILYCIANIEHL